MTDEPTPPDADDEPTVVRHEEEAAGVSTAWHQAGSVRAHRRVDTAHERFDVPREREDVRLRRIPAYENDSGQVETLADGSISIPVYEEELVVQKRIVLRERVIVTKEVVTERERVTARLRKERVEVEGVEGDQPAGAGAPRPGTETRPIVVTSELAVLALFLLALVVTIVATSLTLFGGLLLLVGLTCAFVLSRGFSKAHRPSGAGVPGRRR